MSTEAGAGRGVYLDYAATTPVDSRVAALMAEVLAMSLGNAAANHAAGRAAHALIETARAQVAALIGAESRDIVFTSGASEANNLAITGTVRAALARGDSAHVITLATEHKSVLEPVRALEAQGVAITLLRPDANGRLTAEALAAAIRPNTCLVTLLHVNNETGVAQDLPALRAVCVARKVPLHIDAAQSAGKLPLDIADTALLSFTAHKFGGPQGIGALYVSPAHRGGIQPQMLGGGHERGLRAGTLATHQIAGFGLAAELALQCRVAEAARISALRERLWQGLRELPGVLRNGDATRSAPGILNLTFAGIEGESLFTGLPELMLSTGSACSSRSGEPSYVLRALGRDTEQAQSSLRFSLGRGTTEAHIDIAIAAVRRVHAALWSNSPARPAPVADWQAASGEKVLLGEAGAERLGTWVRFALRVQGDTVIDARVQVYGCPHVVDACNHLVNQLRGQPLAALQPGTPESWRQIVNAPVEKLGRMLIIEDALTALRASATGTD
jgi:cysteine desulfurase